MTEGYNTLLLPVNTLVCGKPHISEYEVTFEMKEDGLGGGSIQVHSLVEYVGTDVVDHMYLIEEGCPKGIDNTIISLIYYNQENWNVDCKWWEGETDGESD